MLSATNILKIGSPIKILCPKIVFDRHFACTRTREVIHVKIEILAKLWNDLGLSYIQYTVLFRFDAFKNTKTLNFDFFSGK